MKLVGSAYDGTLYLHIWWRSQCHWLQSTWTVCTL